MKMSITEALADIKTITERVTKKQNATMPYLARDARIVDPFEKDGGSAEHVKRERQAIDDLQLRYQRIRIAIQKANLATVLAVEGREMTVAEWLVWRKEIASSAGSFQQQMFQAVQRGREEIKRRAQDPAAEKIAPAVMVVNLDEKALLEEIDTHTKILGVLDGKLSLVNATTSIDIE
jgi:hypothetical protein